MLRRRPGRVEVGVTGVALTALVGEWLSHTLECMRQWGVHRAFASVHVYMGPVGFLLLAAGLVGVHSSVQLARSLERRLAELRRPEVSATLRSGIPRAAQSPRSFSVPALVAIVWATQCGLYLVQENLEAGLANRGAAGLWVFGGGHAPALIVHLAVAGVLVAALWLTRREVTRLVHAVRLAEARSRFVRRPDAPAGPVGSARTWTPIDRWGMQLWSRPPPVPRIAY